MSREGGGENVGGVTQQRAGGRHGPTPEELRNYGAGQLQLLIFSQYQLLERLCRKAAAADLERYPGGELGCHRGNEAHVDLESGEFFLQLLDLLHADDFGVLRKWRGRATLESYLASFVANRYLDYARSRRGRYGRPSTVDPVGRVVHRLHFKEDLPPEEVRCRLRLSGVELSAAEVERAIEAVRVRRRLPLDCDNALAEVVSVCDDETGSPRFEPVSPRPGPEAEAGCRELSLRVMECLCKAAASLEEVERRVMLEIYDGCQAGRSKPAEVAASLRSKGVDITAKGVGYRHEKGLSSMRQAFARQGLQLDEVRECLLFLADRGVCFTEFLRGNFPLRGAGSPPHY